MNIDYITSLAASGESETLEFKDSRASAPASPHPRVIFSTILAALKGLLSEGDERVPSPPLGQPQEVTSTGRKGLEAG